MQWVLYNNNYDYKRHVKTKKHEKSTENENNNKYSTG